MSELLSIHNLSIDFKVETSQVRAVDSVSLSVERGQIMGLVGESGSGKTMTALSILDLLPRNGHITEGSIYFGGKPLYSDDIDLRKQVRGSQISMIFQNPMTSLNPLYKVGHQISRIIQRHHHEQSHQAQQQTLSLIQEVGMSHNERVYNMFPHELSGGMRQRIMIAMAISCQPQLIIADEPTTALDVSTQKDILQLLYDINQRHGTALLFITHDLGVVANLCDHVTVMRQGEIIESQNVMDLFSNPQEDYTRQLLNSLPANMNL